MEKQFNEEEQIFNNIRHFICNFDVDTLIFLQRKIKYKSPLDLYYHLHTYFDDVIEDYIIERLDNFRPSRKDLTYLLKKKKEINKSIKFIIFQIIKDNYMKDIFNELKIFLETFKNKQYLIQNVHAERLPYLKDYMNDIFKLIDNEPINVNTRDYCFFDLDGKIFVSKYGETHVSIINNLLIKDKLNRPKLTIENFDEAIKRPTRTEISKVEIKFKSVKHVSYGHIIDGCYLIESIGESETESSASVQKVLKDLLLVRSDLPVNLKKIYEYNPKNKTVKKLK